MRKDKQNTRNISLDGEWAILCDESDASFDAVQGTVTGYLKATVPGNVQKDLENAHCLAPLWYGEIDNKLYGVAMKNWWYKKEFFVPSEAQYNRITLDFEGVDYACEVYINGVPVGSHEGMFERFWLDITAHVVFGGVNTIFVKIFKMPPELLDFLIGSDGKQSGVNTEHFFVTGNNTIRNKLLGLKSPANLSYDWGTNIYTLGIWKPVTVRITDAVRIDWFQIKPLLTEGYTTGTVELIAEVTATVAHTAEFCFSIQGHEADKSVLVTAALTAGENTVKAVIPVDAPQLWWPHGYGQQPLYTALVEAEGSDCATDLFAFRDIQWTDCEGAPENFEFQYQLVLNGTKIRTMGSNLAAVDLLFGTIGSRGKHFIQMARNCNMNTLRLHGGQIVYPKSVYDAADELGVMLFSEYPIGNCCIENDPALLDRLDITYVNIIKQLRNHPSIIEWGGGNELEWYFRPQEDRTGMYRQEAATYSADDTRKFRFTCPVPGSRHAPWDYQPRRHYEIYNGDMGDNFKTAPNMRFGEFGVQTPSNIEVWYRDIPEPSRWPINQEDPVLIRKNAVNAVFSSSMWFGLDIIEDMFGPMDNLEDAIKAGQFLGAEGLRYSVSALRAKGGRMGGFTTWDYNEPWPNAAGSFVIDYDGRPVMMYYTTKAALAPVAIQLRYDSIYYDIVRESFAEVEIVSDAPQHHEAVHWNYKVYDKTGSVFANGNGTVMPEYMQKLTVAKFKINPPEVATFGPVFAEVTLRDVTGEILCEQLYVFACESITAPLRGLLAAEKVEADYSYGGTFTLSGMCGGTVKQTSITASVCDVDEKCLCIELHNTGEIAAMFANVRPLLEYQADLYIDNNFVTIPVGESRKVTITCSTNPEEYSLTLPQLGFSVECFNAKPVVLQPDSTVLLWMGRRDKTCHGYAKTPKSTPAVTDRTIKQETVSWLLQDKLELSFMIEAAPKTAVLQLSIADNDCWGLAQLNIRIGGHEAIVPLAPGIGAQDKEPWRLAWPKLLRVDLPEGTLVQGENSLCITIKNGWLSWDALSLIDVTQEKMHD